jgi:hypothetical protein
LKAALTHWTAVGEVCDFTCHLVLIDGCAQILWFAHPSSAPAQKNSKSSEQRFVGSETAGDIVFLDPQWLLESICSLADHKLMARVASKDVFSIAE